LKNAIKFTPDGGTVTVRTRDEGEGGGGRLVIQVRDTGAGIDPRVLPTIFNAFEQGEHGVNRTFGGLGLGLAISKAVVDLHGGRISAHSDGKGRGACFTLELPGARAAGESAGPAAPAGIAGTAGAAGDGEAVRPQPLRILLVDDHADTLRVLRRLLNTSGHAVTTAGSVADAVRAVQADGFDLLVSDIGLPDGTGLDVVRAARSRHPDLPAIALTGYGMEQDVRNSREAGFNAHLTKPIDLKQLELAIRRLAAGPAYVA